MPRTGEDVSEIDPLSVEGSFLLGGLPPAALSLTICFVGPRDLMGIGAGGSPRLIRLMRLMRLLKLLKVSKITTAVMQACESNQ